MARVTKAERDKLGLEWHDRCEVYGAYSHDRLGVRTIYKDDSGRLWCEWYGKMIEVVRPNFGNGYRTVDGY